MNRTIEINIEPEKYEEICRNTDAREAEKVIGYLSTWNMNIPHVKIFQYGKESEFIAHYYSDDCQHKFTIGAVWRPEEKKFTTHS